DAYGQLDASASYDINETFTVSLEAVNLTNETRLQYYGQRDRVSLVEMTGTRYYLGVRATF
ncbi:MAG: TonB-dependent receptor, partial [Alteromonas sp.]|nr:TonB-dependent receptor [Alteromonas sp.]